jgi:hypothetical protein
MKELLIAAFTAFLGVITSVLGQITVKLFEPAYAFGRTLERLRETCFCMRTDS